MQTSLANPLASVCVCFLCNKMRKLDCALRPMPGPAFEASSFPERSAYRMLDSLLTFLPQCKDLNTNFHPHHHPRNFHRVSVIC